MREIIFSILSLVFSFIVHKWYKRWRDLKKKLYKNDRLEVWDYNFFISFWGVILMGIISAVAFLIKGISLL